MPTTDQLLTLPEAARFLGISAETLRIWVDRDQIAHVRLPSGRARFRTADLVDVLKVRRPEGSE
jgi:excisionase family DNA binding protein